MANDPRTLQEWLDGLRTMRRLRAAFGADLDVVLVAGTQGSFRNRVSPDPAAESDSAGHYFLDFLKLPSMLAMDKTPFSRKADGRRVNSAGLNIQNYYRGPSSVLVGRNGVVRLLSDLIPKNERMLRTLIAAELKKPAATNAPPARMGQ